MTLFAPVTSDVVDYVRCVIFPFSSTFWHLLFCNRNFMHNNTLRLKIKDDKGSDFNSRPGNRAGEGSICPKTSSIFRRRLNSLATNVVSVQPRLCSFPQVAFLLPFHIPSIDTYSWGTSGMARFKWGISVSGTAVFITFLLTGLVREWILGRHGLRDRRLVSLMWFTCLLTYLTSPYDFQSRFARNHSTL
jgi:hypothetical protein